MRIYKKNIRKTENPCVPGSIPGEATIIKNQQNADFFAIHSIKNLQYVKSTLKADVKKDPTTKNAEKVKVTVTTNKELDPDKLPNGWTLGDDKKSVWKIMDKGATEEITLVAKDGSTLTYTVVAGGDKTQASTKIPQAGDKSIVIIATVVVIAIGGIVFFARSRKILK